MATLVLQAAGQAVGGFLGPVGAIVGRAAGALAGHIIDQRLFGDNSTRQVGRIDELTVQTASEGNALPKVYGRMRLAGTVVWATDFEEHVATSSSGKGGGPQVEEFHYTASFAVAIAEGPVARIGARVGRRRAARPHPGDDAHPSRRARPGAGRPDRGDRGRGAGVSRHRLRGVRAPAGGPVRQPHPADDVRGDPPGRRAREAGSRGDADPGRDRVRLPPGGGEAGARARRGGNGQPPPRRGAVRPRSLARRAAGALPGAGTGGAGGGVVRRRSARRRVHHPALRRGAGARDGPCLERRRARPRVGQARQHGRGEPAELWRHAVRQRGVRGDPGDPGARAEGRLLPLHPDGHSGRQRARGPLWRGRAGAVSMARADHRGAGAGARGLAGRDGGGGRRGRLDRGGRRRRATSRPPATWWSMAGRRSGRCAG